MIKKVIQQTKHLVNKASTGWYYNYLRLRLACPVKMPVNESRTISVAIPHFNGAKLAHVSLFNILNDPRIAEIVFLDDGSEIEEFDRLKTKLKPFAQKVKLFRRDANWGPFANKIQAVELCTSDWLVLLDYDNTLLPKYLEAIFNLKKWKKSTIYCPGYAYPHFDFRESLGEQDINLSSTSEMINSGDFKKEFFNDGNYFLHRDSYIQTIKPFWNYSVFAADVIFANYLLLSSQNTLKVLRNSKYIHRIHGGSSWLNMNESGHAFNTTMKRLHAKLNPSDKSLDIDFNKESRKWIEPTRISLR